MFSKGQTFITRHFPEIDLVSSVIKKMVKIQPSPTDSNFNPVNPHDASRHYFATLKNDLIL